MNFLITIMSVFLVTFFFWQPRKNFHFFFACLSNNGGKELRFPHSAVIKFTTQFSFVNK